VKLLPHQQALQQRAWMPPRTACARPGCLGHAMQRTLEVTCARCGAQVWVPDPLIPLDDQGYLTGPPISLGLPYSCRRCRAAHVTHNRQEPPGAAHAAQTGRDSGGPKTDSNAPEMLRTSETIIRDGRAHRPGRPRVSGAQKRTRARERARAYRARRAGGLTA
jgi:hypothetical protein